MADWKSESYPTLGWERGSGPRARQLYRHQLMPLGWLLSFSTDGYPYFENTLQQYCTRYDPRAINLPKPWVKKWTDRGTPLFTDLSTKEEFEEIPGTVRSVAIRRAETELNMSSGIIRTSTTITDSKWYQKYEYRSLSGPTSIRLLKYDGKNDSGIPLFTVEKFNIDKAPHYVALSYTWGNPKPSSESFNQAYEAKYKWPILCNEQVVFVTKNLHDFLQHTKPEYPIPKDIVAGGSPLHYAAYRGQYDVVSNYLQMGMPIDSRDIAEHTPLHLAVRAQHESIVSLLLSHGADINCGDSTGQTPLFLAAKESNVSIVRLLLAQGADCDQKINKIAEPPGYTALHFVIGKGDTEVADVLLKAGASTDIRSLNGAAALHYAVSLNLPGMVKLLLSHGANVETEAYTEDGLSFGTALITAALYDSIESAKILVEHGAYVDARNCYGRTALHAAASDDSLVSTEIALFLVQSAASVTIKSFSQGWTALHCASAWGRVELMEAIIEAGADIEALEDECGRTPLHIACEFDRQDNIKCLLKHGAIVDVHRRVDGKTPLHLAVGRASATGVRLLLQQGADPNARDNEMDAPLHQAMGAFMALDPDQLDNNAYKADQESQRTLVTAILLDYGATIDGLNKNGSTPLHLAAGNRSADMVSLLLRRGANINAITTKGSTPLIFASAFNGVDVMEVLFDQKGNNVNNNDGTWLLRSAVQHGNIAATNFLLARGADVTLRDDDGDTVLHIAANCDQPQIIPLLLQHNVDVHLANNRGRSALDYAVEHRHKECVRVLNENGALLRLSKLEAQMGQLLNTKATVVMDQANVNMVHQEPVGLQQNSEEPDHDNEAPTQTAHHQGKGTMQFGSRELRQNDDIFGNVSDEEQAALRIPYIWIDAICINQADDGERTAQIKIMSQIYENAALVHVWLGLEDANTKLSNHTVRKIVRYSQDKNQYNFDPDLIMWYYMRKRGFLPKEIEVPVHSKLETILTKDHEWSISPEELDALQSLLSRQYFERIWIAQELSRARYVHMTCGKQFILWEDFYRALMILMPARAFFTTEPQVWKRISKGTTAFICAELRSRFHPSNDYAVSMMATITPWSEKSRLSLSALLLLTWGFNSGDPRDKVYALLGLVGQTERIEPDYARSVEDLYTEVAKVLLEGFGKIDDTNDHIVRVTKDDIPSLEPLEALTLAGHGKYFSKDGLPSWVPEFGNAACGPRLWYPGYEPYGKIPAAWCFPGNGVLRIRGEFCEKIAAMEKMSKNQSFDSIHRMPIWLYLATMEDYPQLDTDDEYGPVIRLRHALTSIRSTDTTFTSFSPDQTHNAFKAFLRFCIQKRLLIESSGEHEVNWLDWRRRLKQLYEKDPDVIPSLDEIENELLDEETRKKAEQLSVPDIYHELRAFLDPLMHFTKRYSLFRADDGYVGLVPKTSELGDRLCVFGGASTVFVVREVSEGSNRWRLIGEAFMQNVFRRSGELDIDLE